MDIEDIPGLGRIQRLEWNLLLREFKREINLYLDSTPPEVESRSLAEVMAFNRTNAEKVMPHFDQEIFELSEQTSPSDDPSLDTLARQLKRLAALRVLMLCFSRPTAKFWLLPPSVVLGKSIWKTETVLKAAVAPPSPRYRATRTSPCPWVLLTACRWDSLSSEPPSVNQLCWRLDLLLNKLVSTDCIDSCPHCTPLVFAFDNGRLVKRVKLSAF